MAKLLVVDDDSANRALIATVLGHAGHAVLQASDGADGLKLVQPNSLCVAKFDGKPYPMTGATDGSKSTMSFRKTGAASFEAVTYIDGKLYFKDVYKVSADGKVLTDIGTPEATKKADTIILVRQ